MTGYTRHYIDENDTSWTDAMNYLVHCPREDEGKTLAFISEINHIRQMFIIQGFNDVKKPI